MKNNNKLNPTSSIMFGFGLLSLTIMTSAIAYLEINIEGLNLFEFNSFMFLIFILAILLTAVGGFLLIRDLFSLFNNKQ